MKFWCHQSQFSSWLLSTRKCTQQNQHSLHHFHLVSNHVLISTVIIFNHNVIPRRKRTGILSRAEFRANSHFSWRGVLTSSSLAVSHDVILCFRLQKGGAERPARRVRLQMPHVHVWWRLHAVRLRPEGGRGHLWRRPGLQGVRYDATAYVDRYVTAAPSPCKFNLNHGECSL